MDARHKSTSTARINLFLACALSVILCLAYASTRSTFGGSWYQANGGGVPYVMFWILLAGCAFPQRRYCFRISLIVVAITCGLELLQLWNPEPLASFRQTRFGAALLGSSFAWNDIPPYFIGGGFGGAILWLLGSHNSQAGY